MQAMSAMPFYTLLCDLYKNKSDKRGGKVEDALVNKRKYNVNPLA